MKKIKKQLMVFVLVLVTALNAAPITTQAAINAPKKETVYRTSKDTSVYCYGWIDISGLSKSSKVKKVKSSKKSVAEVAYLSHTANTYYSKNESLLDSKAKPSTYSNKYYSADIQLSLIKAGTTKITYTIGKKSYTTSLTVKDYTNPLKTVEITGLEVGGSSNLKSLVDDQNSDSSLSLGANQENSTITLEAKDGWMIDRADMQDYYSNTTYSVSNYSTGLSSATFSCGNLKKDHRYALSITLTNTKNNGTLDIYYYINPAQDTYC